jgi:hypothetical protein
LLFGVLFYLSLLKRSNYSCCYLLNLTLRFPLVFLLLGVFGASSGPLLSALFGLIVLIFGFALDLALVDLLVEGVFLSSETGVLLTGVGYSYSKGFSILLLRRCWIFIGVPLGIVLPKGVPLARLSSSSNMLLVAVSLNKLEAGV